MISLLLIGSVFNFIVLLIGMVYTKRWQATTFYFNLCLGMCFVTSLIVYLNFSQLTVYFPHVYRTGLFFFYVFLGSGLLFTKKSLAKRPILWSDLLFFIPALIFLIDYAPYHLHSTAYKRAIYQYDFAHKEINSFKQGWFIPQNTHFRLRFIVAVLIAFYQIFIVYQLWKKHDKTFLKENSALIKWIVTYSLLLLITFFTQLPAVLSNLPPNITHLTDAVPTFILLFSYPVSLLFNPEILYGTKGFWSDDTSKKPEVTVKATPKIYFSVENAEKMTEKLQIYMDTGRPYLNPEYNLTQLANDTDLPVRHVSSLLNNFLDMSTSDYINQFRVRYFIERYQNDPEAKKITFEALANECGFNTRYTFINAFKKQTGQTPSQYFGANQN